MFTECNSGGLAGGGGLTKNLMLEILERIANTEQIKG